MIKFRYKRHLRYIIPAIIICLCLMAWWPVNYLLASRLRLIDIVDIGDLQAAKYVCRWDREQLDLPQPFTSLEAVYDFGPGIKSPAKLPRPIMLGASGRRDHRLPERIPGTYKLLPRTCTPARLAVRRNNLAMVKTLIQSGASPILPCADGVTPIHEAAANGYVEIADYLLQVAECVNIRSKVDGTSPLHAAIGNGQYAMVGFLLSRGANADQTDSLGRVPLHECAGPSASFPKIARTLLDSGANVDVRDQNGLTPLHTAAKYVCPQLLDVLIKGGASVNTCTQDGRTPLDIVLEIPFDGEKKTKERQSCATLLIRSGGKKGDQLPALREFVGIVESTEDFAIQIGGGHPKSLVRLQGLLFPSKGHPHVLKALEALQAKILGRKVRVVRDQHKEHYVDVYVGNRWVNEELIAEGQAFYYFLAFPDQKLLWEAQVRARNKKLGLWKLQKELPAWQEGLEKKFRIDREGNE